MRNCPRCNNALKRAGNTLFCQCGWTHSKQKQSGESAIIYGMVLTCGLIAGSLFHFFQWGSHGFSIVFSSPEKKVKICMDLKKYDCVEKNLARVFEKTGDVAQLEKLGEFQFKREKFEEAKQTYKLYFSKKGKNYKAAYYYAHSLARTGDIEESIRYFDSLLRSKPQVLMVTVMESYLHVLVNNNRKDKAKEILSWADSVSSKVKNASNQIQEWKKKFNI